MGSNPVKLTFFLKFLNTFFEKMSPSFALIATGAFLSVFQMTKSKNPVHSVFYLVLLFLHCSRLLVQQGLEYFVQLQLQVYVGALAILFLFVVMLQDIPSTEILAHQRGTYPVAGVLFFCLRFAAFQRVWQPFSSHQMTVFPLPSLLNFEKSSESSLVNFFQYSFWDHSRRSTSPIANQGIALYGVHPDQLILASLLLLVAMVGAVGLTLKRPVAAPDYDVFAQHYVDFRKVVVQIPKEHSLFFLSFEKMRTDMTKLRGSLWNQPVLTVVQNHQVRYPTPSNLNGNYNWGVLAGLCLVLQILTGIFLAMHYTAHVDLAFHSVQHQMRDVPNGWLLRYQHANGASLFFIVVYMHQFRGLYYTSYAQPREFVWLIGVVILQIMILTAFIGYVLPWGQMSQWGRTVITSLASALPIVGTSIVSWLWGGFGVDNPTLNRFYSFHYQFPFLLAALSLVHLAALHQYGSTNPLGISRKTDQIDFYPYFYSKDQGAALALRQRATFQVSFYPEALGHPDNNIPANPYSTPAHIVPEWYFLAVYRILRSIPNKLAGVGAVAQVFQRLALLPYMHKPRIRGPAFQRLHQKIVMCLIGDCFLLTWQGSMPVEAPYVLQGQQATAFFFLSMRMLCIVGRIEGKLIKVRTASNFIFSFFIFFFFQKFFLKESQSSFFEKISYLLYFQEILFFFKK